MWWILLFPSLADSPQPPSAWDTPDSVRLDDAFPLPAGFTRRPRTLFGEWLGGLPVEPADRAVRTHDGRVVRHPARVIALPMVSGDLQQCADSALRLRAEYERQVGRPVMFHSTSGDEMSYARWAGGERPVVRDGHLAWVPGGDRSWDGYLTQLFNYAGTASLEVHDTISARTPRAGDLLVEGGYPGHAIVLLDVVVRGSETRVLVGEGFMPAQDFHVELGPLDGWWAWEDGVALPHWPLGAEDLRRWAR